jgi:hypothetical protein
MKFKTCSLAGITIWLAFAPSAQAGPTFDLFGLVPGGDFFNINQSPFPVDQFLSGTDGFIGSGSVFAKAKLGELGTKATVVNTALPIIPPDQRFASSIGRAHFADEFPLDIPGPISFGTLAFTVSLDGTTTMTGATSASEVHLDFNGISTSIGGQLGGPGVTLTGPGTAIDKVGVFIGVPSSLFIFGDLDVDVSTDGAGGVIADFSQSFQINAVQLFDSHGNFIQDVTLVDDAGNLLPIGTVPHPTVPGPGSAMLLAIGVGILGAVRLRSRGYCQRIRAVGSKALTTWQSSARDAV